MGDLIIIGFIMNYFSNTESIADLKNKYKKLAFKHHPDRGGNTETMQKINAEYDLKLKELINKSDDSQYKNTSSSNSFWDSKEEHSEVEIKVKEALDMIIHLEGLEIEIIGVWIWVEGNTKPHKEVLKKAGFKWNMTLVKWFFAGKKSNGKGNMSIDKMREKYGCESVKNKHNKKLKIA